jgi:hypothetical protein
MSITVVRETVDLLAVAREYASNPRDWTVPLRYDPERRWYHRLATLEYGEAWLLSWLPGQGTQLHDHGGSSGAFVIVSGTLTERTLAGDRDSTSLALTGTRYGPGRGRSFGGHHIHQVVNDSTEPAVSLHVYGPALIEMTRYEIASGRLLTLAVERAGADW